MLRAISVLLILSGSVFAQMPRGFYAWWAKPAIRKDLNLTNQQQRQIRDIVLQYRSHLIDVRSDVNKAETELQAQFDHDPVDSTKANGAIERLIAARSDLTRTLSQMSLKLRTVLNEQQWQELQRRRPGHEEDAPAPTESPVQK